MKKITLSFIFVLALVFALPASASTNITAPSYAWSESVGWINFDSATSSVIVTDSELTGFAYSDNTGWISLNCSNLDTCGDVDYKVSNDGQGTLSGYAWSESVGWIDFTGVFIEDHQFGGYAYNDNTGFISFNCSNTESCEDVDYGVSTTWAPAVPDPEPTHHHSSGGGSRKASTAIPVNSPTTGTIGSATSTYLFTRDLTIGATGPDVLALQKYLNSKGFLVATAGAGSPGFETTYFGQLTRAALARFQAANGIVPAIGYFGPITRAFVAK